MEMDEEYIDNVKNLIEQKDAENVKALLIDLHPADIAELCNDLSPEEARFVYRQWAVFAEYGFYRISQGFAALIESGLHHLLE